MQHVISAFIFVLSVSFIKRQVFFCVEILIFEGP
jgi:hypothetical protein